MAHPEPACCFSHEMQMSCQTEKAERCPNHPGRNIFSGAEKAGTAPPLSPLLFLKKKKKKASKQETARAAPQCFGESFEGGALAGETPAPLPRGEPAGGK